MHQRQFTRDRRNQYLYELNTLHQLSDEIGITLPEFIGYLSNLRKITLAKEVLQVKSVDPNVFQVY